jgi:hypothetical protein
VALTLDRIVTALLALTVIAGPALSGWPGIPSDAG